MYHVTLISWPVGDVGGTQGHGRGVRGEGSTETRHHTGRRRRVYDDREEDPGSVCQAPLPHSSTLVFPNQGQNHHPTYRHFETSAILFTLHLSVSFGSDTKSLQCSHPTTLHSELLKQCSAFTGTFKDNSASLMGRFFQGQSISSI